MLAKLGIRSTPDKGRRWVRVLDAAGAYLPEWREIFGAADVVPTPHAGENPGSGSGTSCAPPIYQTLIGGLLDAAQQKVAPTETELVQLLGALGRVEQLAEQVPAAAPEPVSVPTLAPVTDDWAALGKPGLYYHDKDGGVGWISGEDGLIINGHLQALPLDYEMAFGKYAYTLTRRKLAASPDPETMPVLADDPAAPDGLAKWTKAQLQALMDEAGLKYVHNDNRQFLIDSIRAHRDGEPQPPGYYQTAERSSFRLPYGQGAPAPEVTEPVPAPPVKKRRTVMDQAEDLTPAPEAGPDSGSEGAPGSTLASDDEIQRLRAKLGGSIV